MLHKEEDIISAKTLDLLRRLQQDPQLEAFFLVGGTALAMQIGHRYSIDLDLFTKGPIDTQSLTDHLSRSFDFQLNAVAPNTILGVIEGVKCDFLTHTYPIVRELIVEDGIRLASLEDIGAMKLNAIGHSGQRLKDFIDIYFLLEYFPLKVLLNAYEVKYPQSNLVVPVKGLSYFEDIDWKSDIPIMRKAVDRKLLQKRLLRALEEPGLVF